jgi:subtilase family serine protease
MCRNPSLILRWSCLCAKPLLVVLPLILASVAATFAQTSPGPSQPLITQPINERNLVVLAGNTRPEAQSPANDRGVVPDSMPLPHLMLQLRRPTAQERALERLIDQLHDPRSPNFHHWLSAGELGAQFGPAAADIQTITVWLQQHGFTVNSVYPNGMVIDFSGTAGQIRTAFHTEIHKLSVNGVAHIANMSDPQIPAALAPAVVGIVSLHNFMPHPATVRKSPAFTSGGKYYMAPPDLATIYNFKPLFASGTTGQAQTIYLLEDADMYDNHDWTTFRSGFGLSSYAGATLTTVHPQPTSGSPNCTDPGAAERDFETELDTEWASAAAPSAAIVVASCADTTTVWGGLYALQNLVNSPSPPAIMTVTIEECEVYFGAQNATYNTAYQTGVVEGISIYVAAGDWAEAQCDGGTTTGVATHGIGVSGFASSPYVVAVGGTDFADTYLGQNSTYWNSTNTSSEGSAQSYVPEIAWNTTCGSKLFATYTGYTTTYGASGFCNSSTGKNYLAAWGGSGGPSACATGAPSTPGVVSGTCTGYPKPSWQTGVIGIPTDGVRDLPDVALFSSSGPWNHAYVVCFSDTRKGQGGTKCKGTASGWTYGWGGTSFATPIWAGIQALINQTAGDRQGNPNYQLYKLAATEYGSSGSSACNSSNGNAVAGSCIFYDITQGDNDTDCQADSGTLYNCYLPSGTYGVMSTSNSSYEPAYQATVGWDFVTGLGSVNAANLVNNWGAGNPALTVTPMTTIYASGPPFKPASFSYTLSATNGSVEYSITNVPSWLTASSMSGTVTASPETVTFTVNSNAKSLPPGSYVAEVNFNNVTDLEGSTKRAAELIVLPPKEGGSPPGCGQTSSGSNTCD